MKVYITAKPKSKKAYIKKLDDSHYTVAVNEPPISGQANKAILKSLAEYFHKPFSQLQIISGEKIKHKVIEIPLSAEDLEIADSQKKLF